MASDSSTRRRSLIRTTPRQGPCPLVAGGVLGRFHLRGLLGSGTTGLVFEAEEGERLVALKVLWPALWHDARQVAQLLHEAELGQRLRHPGFVRVLASGLVPGGGAYLSMELLKGEGLGARLRRHGGGPLPGALGVIAQLAGALAAAHACGIVHRDLKPDNVMLVADTEEPGQERAKVLDLGLARDAGTRLGRADGIVGTPAYMAPEQCRAGALVDTHGDVYSLGVVAYELLTGALPFDADHHSLIMEQHRSAAPRPLRAAHDAVTGPAEALVGRMLAKDPTQRPTMAEVAAEAARLHRLASAPRPARATSQLTPVC